jgi:hypothetical protein
MDQIDQMDEGEVDNDVRKDTDVANILVSFPGLPVWNDNLAMAFPEHSYCDNNSESSGSASARSTADDRFNNIIQERQLEENAIIDSIIEEYTADLDSNVAEVMDTNTYVSSEMQRSYGT